MADNVIEEGVEVHPDTHPDAFIGKPAEDNQREIAKRFELPETATVSEILDKIIVESGQNVPISYLLIIASLCGANIQLHVVDKDDLEVPQQLD